MERFRKYLGKQYLNSNLYQKIPSPPPATRAGVPIYPIYILGYKLGSDYEKMPVLVVENNVYDRFSRKQVPKNNPFITSLFHEGMIIQIPELKKQRRDRVENLLSIYDNAELYEKFVLDVSAEDYPPELRAIISRLVAAAADDDIRGTMEAEDELLREIELWEEEIENKKKEVRETKKELRKAQKQIAGTKAQLDGTKAQLDGTKAQLDGTKAQLDGTKAQLDGTKAELDKERQKAKEAEKQAKEAEKQAKEAEKQAKEVEKQLSEERQKKADAELSVRKTLKNSALAFRLASFSDEKIAEALQISLSELIELFKD
jgi:chromosome segregation ATPase